MTRCWTSCYLIQINHSTMTSNLTCQLLLLQSFFVIIYYYYYYHANARSVQSLLSWSTVSLFTIFILKLINKNNLNLFVSSTSLNSFKPWITKLNFIFFFFSIIIIILIFKKMNNTWLKQTKFITIRCTKEQFVNKMIMI